MDIEDFLNEIYKNLRMATWAIDVLSGNIKNNELKELVKKQNEIYLDYTERCEDLAKEINYTLDELSCFLKTCSWMSIKISTLFDKGTSHIAQKLIQGNNMGIITLMRAINHLETKEGDAYALALEVKESEEKFVNSLKEFL